MILSPAPSDWLSWRRTLNQWGYSPLEQIDKKNVARLRLVWTRPLAEGVQEGTPLAALTPDQRPGAQNAIYVFALP